MGRLMAKMLRLEWIKWFPRRESRFSIVFLLAATVGYGVLLKVLLAAELAPTAVSLLTGTEPTGFHLAYTVAHTVLRVLGLFALLWSSASVAGELEQGTLRMPLLRLPRRAFPLGKALFFSAVVAGLAVLILLLSVAVGAWGFGLESVDVGRVTVQSTGHLLRSGVLATLLMLLPLWSIVALGTCVSCLVRSSQLALTLSITTAIVLWGASLAPGVGEWVFSSTLSGPFKVALGQSEGLKTVSFDAGLARHCLVNVAWIAGFLFLGAARFERRDLTT